MDTMKLITITTIGNNAQDLADKLGVPVKDITSQGVGNGNGVSSPCKCIRLEIR